MGNLTPVLNGDLGLIADITTFELFLALASSALFTFILAKLYVATHQGYSYSKSFLHTIVLAGVTVALIMVVIGSEIARAFALVGAMSIVRFRTPVKDPRDLVFVFAAIAIGMACGVRFYMFAGIFTLFMAALVLGFRLFNFGELPHTGYVLKVRVRGSERDRVTAVCSDMCRQTSIVSISKLSRDDELEDIIYEVDLKRGVAYEQLIDRLAQIVNPLSINLLVGESRVNA